MPETGPSPGMTGTGSVSLSGVVRRVRGQSGEATTTSGQALCGYAGFGFRRWNP